MPLWRWWRDDGDDDYDADSVVLVVVAASAVPFVVVAAVAIVGGGRRCRVRSRSAIVLRKNPTGTDRPLSLGRCRYAVGFTCSFF